MSGQLIVDLDTAPFSVAFERERVVFLECSELFNMALNLSSGAKRRRATAADEGVAREGGSSALTPPAPRSGTPPWQYSRWINLIKHLVLVILSRPGAAEKQETRRLASAPRA
jgi:hypothetical protein